MIKIKDKYILGIIVSIIANFIRNIFNSIFYMLNINQYLPRQLAAATFIPADMVDTRGGMIIGIFADYGVAIFIGIFIVYLLYYIGIEFNLIKGISVGIFFWINLFGMMLKYNLSDINPTDINTNLIFLVNHILLGALIAWLAVKLGKDLLSK
ncbi:hypothetical protein [Natronospora cellulosivora (SeqCode)]